MSPEAFYWLAIAVKMAIGASVVIGATIATERAGPLIGALVATLPVSAVMANGITGLIGFGIAAYVLHVSVQSLGVPSALTIALCITVAWNLGVFTLRGRARG